MADVGDREVMTQPERVEYIIDKGCEYFGVDKKDLISPNRGRSAMGGKKRYLSMVLSEYTVLNVPEITELLSYSSPQNVYRNILGLKQELSEELYGCEKTKRIYNELLSYLNL